jgi:hypothetical protein
VDKMGYRWKVGNGKKVRDIGGKWVIWVAIQYFELYSIVN